MTKSYLFFGTIILFFFASNHLMADKETFFAKNSATYFYTVTDPLNCGELINSSFENGLTNWTNNGNTVISTSAKTGTKAVKTGTGEGGVHYGSLIPVLPGNIISFSCWAKIEQNPAWAGLGLDFLDASGNEIPNSKIIFQVTSTSYAQIFRQATVPAGTVKMRIWTWKSGTTGYLYLDDFCFTILVNGVSLSPQTFIMKNNDVATATATLNPSNATNKTVSWSSDNSWISITPSSNALIATLKANILPHMPNPVLNLDLNPDISTIILYQTTQQLTLSGSILKMDTAFVNISVRTEDGGYVASSIVKLPNEKYSYRNITFDDVNLVSSNTSVVVVSPSGLLTPIGIGTADITLTTKQWGFSQKVTVNVNPRILVTDIQFAPPSLSLVMGTKAKINATVLPENATNKALAWNTLDQTIATVDQNGEVTANAVGSVTLLVVALDNHLGYGHFAVTKYYTVNVLPRIPNVSVSITPKTMQLERGKTAQLSISISNTTNKKVRWLSNKASIVAVDSTGFLTAWPQAVYRNEQVIIKAFSVEGGAPDSCIVNAYITPVTGLVISPKIVTLEVDGTANINATIIPDNATNKRIIFAGYVTDPVATIDQTGLITAISPGSIKIPVVADDSWVSDLHTYTITDTVYVTVVPKAVITKYEAENASLYGVSVATAETGYSGTGYVDGGTLNNTGDKITFTVNVPVAGLYPLVIRFKNTCGICDKYQLVKVNSGSDVATLFRPTTANWEDLNYGNISLNAGNNTIVISKSWGWSHIDYITIGTAVKSAYLNENPNSYLGFVKIYPNPVSADGQFIINFGNLVTKSDIILMDLTGKVIRSWSVYNCTESTVNSAGLEKGMYIINIQSEGKPHISKIIVE